MKPERVVNGGNSDFEFNGKKKSSDKVDKQIAGIVVVKFEPEKSTYKTGLVTWLKKLYNWFSEFRVSPKNSYNGVINFTGV
ncbi:MAG: hypothetical protein ABEJ56_04455 [Candidatus Nanohaloarchaea archaeon]